MTDDGAMLEGFLDTLLPGDDVFPAAMASGMVLLARARLAGLEGRLNAALMAHGWGGGAPEVVVAAVEAAAPDLFDAVRKVVYLTYYEQPAVVAAIRALGFAYNDTPLPEGYPAERFDPATDMPRHGRGDWVATDAVVRLDLSCVDLPGIAENRS